MGRRTIDTVKPCNLKELTDEHHRKVDGFNAVAEAIGVPPMVEACQAVVGK